MIYLAICLALFLGGSVSALGQRSSADSVDPGADSSVIARELASTNPAIRQRAAEDLARLAAIDQRKLVEGYQLQEKDKRVRLALDWALYRMGRSETLFRIVENLNSSRHDQAVGYLAQLESPKLLYPFLQQSNHARVTVGVLEALGQAGDTDSVALIQPFRDSVAPGVSAAAETAIEKIEERLSKIEPPTATRPRSVNTESKNDQ